MGQGRHVHGAINTLRGGWVDIEVRRKGYKFLVFLWNVFSDA